MTPSRGTTRRSIRVADELWQATQAAAERNGETVSDVARRAFVRYVRADARSKTTTTPKEQP